MPVQGALIRAVDHNNVQELLPKSIARILADRITDFPFSTFPDTATYGYGQSLASNDRAIGEVVTADHMAALKLDVLKIARHCGVDSNALITSLPSIVSGDIIDNDHLFAYEAALELLNDSRFLVAEGQYSLESTVPNISHSRTTPWGNVSIYAATANIRHSFTLDFGSPEDARYFFNSGGQIRFSASRSGGTNSFQNQSWTNLLNEMGTIIFDYQTTITTGTGNASNIGFYQLTNTPQQIFTKNAGSIYVYSYQYSSNDYTITAHTDVPNNQFGGARYIYFNVYFNDDHTATRSINDIVDGVTTSNVSLKRATGPNVSVTAPIATNTRLISS